MNEKHIAIIAAQANISVNQVLAVVELLDADSTIPFIARYRKEATGSLDEVQIGCDESDRPGRYLFAL